MKERKINLDTETWDKVKQILGPDTSISYVVNTLLFHFYGALTDGKVDLNTYYKDAAERTHEDIED